MVRIRDLVAEGSTPAIVMDLMVEGDLRRAVAAPCAEATAAAIVAQIADGLPIDLWACKEPDAAWGDHLWVLTGA